MKLHDDEYKALRRDLWRYRAQLAAIRRSITLLPPGGRRQEFMGRAERINAMLEEWSRFLGSSEIEVSAGGKGFNH